MSRVPSKDEILTWLRENPGQSGKREIARAFGVKGANRVALKQILREMQADGLLARERGAYRDSAALPPVAVLVVEAPDAEGELMAVPQHWQGTGEAPRVQIVARRGDPALGEGDRVLCRIARIEDETGLRHEGRLIRRLAPGPQRVLGIFRKAEQGGRILPVTKGEDREWLVAPGETGHAREGELVEGEVLGRPSLGLPRARVAARLGDPGAPRAVSLIAVHEHGLPVEFPESALEEAEAARPVALGEREDLRALPFVTIDPEDARDHDDAVCAMPDDATGNPGGWILWVAIADVAHYAPPGGALDREARRRGNSTYFPDRVVPMLPEALSGGLCSLHEALDRPCLAVRMVLGADGRKRSHRFARALMRSQASLTYEEVQRAADGGGGMAESTLAAIRDLYGAYRSVQRAREERQPLDLDLPERRIVLSPEGKVTSVAFRERLEAHRLIEEFMILANVAAAETLEAHRRPLIYRVHEEPTRERLEALREIVEGCGLALAKGQVLKTAHFNRLLAQAAGKDFAEMLHLSVLRTQTQAYYSPKNLGHFGLNLARYAHFTSPIRRYADLVVHRALISAHGWGRDGLSPGEVELLEETAKHISMTERRSM
ncbi:MAG TPA: RNB domain-containing ribonuclease, partial [Paracoccaceae bacterium]|nr:RNB domain-containing ribonuclease [Paracoccaceae bacterium]